MEIVYKLKRDYFYLKIPLKDFSKELAWEEIKNITLERGRQEAKKLGML